MDQVQHWATVLRHQWLVMAVVFLLIVGGAIGLLKVWPRTYEASAKFLVRNARQDFVVNPSDRSAPLGRSEVSEETLNTEIELLRGRDILAKVAKDLRLNTPGTPGEDPEISLQRAIGRLSNELTIAPIRRTNLIQVDYTSPDAKQAAKVLRHLADTYMALHLAIHSSPGTYEFFRQQSVASQQKWEEAQRDLTALARRADLIAPDDQRRAALQGANETEAQLAMLEAQIGEQASRARSSDTQMGTVDNRIMTQARKLPNQASVEQLHTMLAELQNKRTQLLTKFNATDRLVVEIETQMANTAAALKEASALKATEESTDVNPSWQTLQTERVNAALALAGLTTKAARLRTTLAEYRARAVTLTEAAPQHDLLRRRVSEAAAEHELYTKRAEEARVDEALDKQKISNVVLAEGPVVPPLPAYPRVKLATLVAGAVAMLCAIVAGLLAEWRRARAVARALARRRRTESYTGVTAKVAGAHHG